MHFTFGIQDEFLSGATQLNEQQVKQKICQFAAPEFQFTIDECLQALANSDYELATRTAWKFAAENRITGTPTFWINGVNSFAPFDEQDWQDFIDQYVTETRSENKSTY